jgi:hypothetical protein
MTRGLFVNRPGGALETNLAGYASRGMNRLTIYLGIGLVLGVWALFIHDNFLIGVFTRFLLPVFTSPTSGPVAVDLSTGAAISMPKGVVQGDLGRNVLSGFVAAQVDLTLRRQFKLKERLSLHARADFFNIFNHPNFARPINYLSSPQFGQSTQMLASGLGSGGSGGGLNPLYQIGGPRSAQLALKLLF